MEAVDQVKKFQEFFGSSYQDEILNNIKKEKNFLIIDFNKISKFDPGLADELLENPEEVIRASEVAVEGFDFGENIKNFKIRFKNLPEDQKIMIRNIRSKHIGKFLFMDGVVRQKSDVRPQVTSCRFECPSCGNVISVLQLDTKFKEPSRCGCGRKGKFRLLSKELVDAQGIVLEEAPEDLEGSEQPKRMNILLENDLVSPITEKRTNPGSKIKVYGIVKEVPIILRTGSQSTRFDLVVEANYVESVEEDFYDIEISKEEEKQIKELAKDPNSYERLVKSMASSIYGYEKVKEALLLQLVGGVPKIRSDGVATRGDMHILLVGDPGAGKCLHGETKVILQNGDIVSVKNIADKTNFCDGNKEIEELCLPSLYFNGEITSGNAVRIWKRKYKDRLLKIKTRTGKVLLLTKNHPLFTLIHGFIVAKQAKDFKKGERIATPRRIPINGSLQIIPKYLPKRYSNNSKCYKYPEIVDKKLARALGYLCGDGYLAYSKTSGWVSLTNNDEDVLKDFCSILKVLFKANLNLRHSHKGKKAKEVYLLSKALVRYFEVNFNELFGGSKNKNIPNLIIKSSNKILAEFIKSLFECDSHINISKRQIEFCTISKDMAEKLQYCLLRLGIVALLKKKKKFATNTKNKRIVNAYELIIAGNFVEKYYNEIGYVSNKKKAQLKKLISKITYYNTNIDLIPHINNLLKQIRIENKLTQSQMGIPRPTYAHFEQENRLPSVDTAKKIVKHLKSKVSQTNNLRILKQIVNAEIFWDEIIDIKSVKNDGEFVYDLEVTATHNYIANGVVVHNSQLLKRINLVAPKSRYVSGKGVSGAGLTASVVKDEFLRGWALEAGALVLASKGVCCIDELDKMSPEDRAAMHEALEQQTISISKANIQATLIAKTTVLAAANPKFGRFDQYEVLAKQIDLPPTLINRFDLIFPIKDLPNKERDDEMAKHILNLHQNPKFDEPEIPTKLLKKYIAYVKRNINPVLTDEALDEIKRYYLEMRSKSNSEDAASRAVPISPRQLEALVRLSEAAARVRFSKKVEKMDAKKATELLHYCLSEVGVDPETGKIDIDRISTGISATERSKIINVREIINELENTLGKTIPIDDIMRDARERGLDEAKVEEAIEKLKRSGDLFEPRKGFIQKL